MEKRERLQISRRLQAVAGLASTGMVLADVGCDHGYIPIYLLLKKRIPRAIAMDVNQGPLLRAEEHIRAWGLEKYIETRLSDGLCALAPGEAQCIVIAGMGGPLMEKILTEGEDRAKAARELILQPQSEIGRFRRFLSENGHCILEETMIREDGKYYPMMKAVCGEMKYEREAEYRYGKELLVAKNPVLKEFLLREQAQADQILSAIQDSSTDSARSRRKELEEECRVRKEALAYYEV